MEEIEEFQNNLSKELQDSNNEDKIDYGRLVSILAPVTILLMITLLSLYCCYLQRQYRSRVDKSLYCKAMENISPWKQSRQQKEEQI